MNTIPLTFDEHQINRTVLGGRKNLNENALNISVILLNSKGSHFKLHLFENLIACNFKTIVSIEKDGTSFNMDDISRKFPEIKFIIPLEKTNDGDLINLAMGEIDSEYALVLRDTLNIPSGIILPNLADTLTKDKTFCIVPRLLDENRKSLPCVYTPRIEKTHFMVDSSIAVIDGMKTLFPHDNIALYNREKFIMLGGYDWTIDSNYWQIMDLAIRSWLWGEETRLTSMLQFSYNEKYPIPDKTVNIDYLRYYLKNELPILKMETGYIKKSSFFIFKLRSSCGFFEARRQFHSAREWVEQNKYKFKMDLETFIESWGKNEK